MEREQFDKFVGAFSKHEGEVVEQADHVRGKFKEEFIEAIDAYVLVASAGLGVLHHLTEPVSVAVSQSARIGLLGQIVLSHGRTYDAISTGFYGDAVSSLRRIYEHLIYASAWRLEGVQMERLMATGCSFGKVQNLSDAPATWQTLYGDLSRVTHPEGRLDPANSVPLSGGTHHAFILKPMYDAILARDCMQTLLPLTLAFFREARFLVAELCPQADISEEEDLAATGTRIAENLGLIRFVPQATPVLGS